MKKYIIILLLLFFVFQSYYSFSQNNQIKFIALTVLVANQSSISYEYTFTKNHSLGIQFQGDLLINPMTYYTKYNQSVGIHINYRYYFLPKNRWQLFSQIEVGYSQYSSGDVSVTFYSNEIGGGPLLGFRKSIGSNKIWFFDFVLGLNIVRRDYYKVYVDWDIMCETTDHEGHNHIPIELPSDETLLKPRVIIEFGFKF